jgi:membrane fusion protein (multidrug efflux system)
MSSKKSFRRRLLTILGVSLLAVILVSGAGFIYLRSVDSASAAEATTAEDQESECPEGDEDCEAKEAECEEGDEDCEAKESDCEEGDEDCEAKESECEEGDEDCEEETKIPVSVAEVERGAVSSYVSATSNLVAENEVMVLAEAEGRVQELLVEEGQMVRKGELLASLVRDDAQIAFDKAKVKATNTESAYARSERLGAEGLITEEELDRTGMENRIAQQELAEAKWRLDRTEIRAPFDGRITSRMITLGQHVRPADELFRVTDFEPLISRIYLPERDIIGLEEGRDVRITLKADDSVSFQGRIRQISHVVDVATGTVKLTIEAIRPPKAVRPGGFVTIDIIRETHPDALVLPREAVIRELQSAHVFVAKDDDTAERRDITLGMEEGNNVEVTSGLDAGERVVVAGQGGLKDGAALKILSDEDDTKQASDLTEKTDEDEAANS